ncbi:MAG: GMC family oxidoreductase [Pseudomonadota bacterium]
MLTFLDELPTPELTTSVCVVGGGPAGIILARELAAQGVDVVLCEGGGLEPTTESQECYEGETIGDDYHYLDAARLRFLGGTSNHWSGVCATLDPEDLDSKPFAPQTGWPIEMAELRPYIDRARDMLGLTPALPPQPVLNGNFARIDVRLTGHLRFRDIYLEELRTSQKITTVLNANLIGIDHSNGQISKMHFRSYEERSLSVTARHFVIACGGIENARLLMHLNETQGSEFGTASGALGRYFTEHPHGKIGEYVIFDSSSLDFPGYGKPVSRARLAHFSATPAFLEQAKSLQMRVKLYRYRGGTDTRRVIQDLMCNAPNLTARLTSRFTCAGVVGMVLEQVPLAENRIELSEDRDRFGIRRPILYWKWSDQDYQTIREVALAFAQHLAEADIGRMSLSDWVLDPSQEIEFNEDITAYHHIGTTRMTADATTGVVDPNCRVFGSENLYLSGSSVFPSGGHANPTAPIMGLSLRLADHLSSRAL